MTRGAAAAEAGPEPDQETANDDSDKAAWKLWHWHGVADKHSGSRRSDQAGDEGRAPSAVARLLVDEAVKNPADAGDAASEQLSSTAENPISAPPIAAETGVKLAMTLPRNRVAVLSGQLLLQEIRSVLSPSLCYRSTGPLAFFQASIPPSI